MRLKRLQLLLLLATTLSCQSTREAAAAAAAQRSSPSSENEPRVKLCGRDFVRAVIFTCGGSRWKRIGEQQQSAAREPLPGSARAAFVQASSKNGLKNINPQSLWDFKLKRLRSGSRPASEQLLRDLYNLYDDYNDYVPISDEFNDHTSQVASGVHKRGETSLITSMESYSFPQVKYPRRKRDMSLGIAAMCCRWGCTKKEISVLC